MFTAQEPKFLCVRYIFFTRQQIHRAVTGTGQERRYRHLYNMHEKVLNLVKRKTRAQISY